MKDENEVEEFRNKLEDFFTDNKIDCHDVVNYIKTLNIKKGI